MTEFKTDIEIAQQAQLNHINSIAQKLNIPSDELELYGKYKAKLPLRLLDQEKIEFRREIIDFGEIDIAEFRYLGPEISFFKYSFSSTNRNVARFQSCPKRVAGRKRHYNI